MNATDRMLKDWVECFNRGVETGDFRSLLKLFSDDVSFRVHGSSAGTLTGRDAIANNYRRNPPSDEIEFIDSHERNGEVVVGYSWLRHPHVRAGEMRMAVDEAGLVNRIEITV